ncbi:MAG: hypothetical protein U0894_07670 [Pirellulales bacterium]
MLSSKDGADAIVSELDTVPVNGTAATLDPQPCGQLFLQQDVGYCVG